MSDPVQNRYDIVYFFDIADGNPNGDPDAGNLPRLDPETGQGLVTDVCLKRKVRNYVILTKENTAPYLIYVKERAILNDLHEKAYQALKIKPVPKKLPKEEAKARDLTAWMCANFFDIRTFGAVMTTKVNCGQVRGPIQFGIARSLHRIVPSEFSITRCAVTSKEDFEGSAAKGGKDREMGRKFAIPYALYRVHAYVNPTLAACDNGTGFSETDLDLFKKALDMMFEQDKSAARANMKPVACIAFKHDNAFGNARADQLFSRVTCAPKDGVQPLPNDPAEESNEGRPPRSFEDYQLKVNEDNLPAGVTIERWINWE